ncbi:hypothetical protein ONE63_007916 [Megalurothrips usitatus]|uniref:Uncharacterized protein n=1 Tax=Megalurothrips usitatus TaxID=439358 RepID=A0AAV7XP74_9NEOP|nr:hypothetical protein ONE63_007916 [Megalurothrips usitatus]
MHPFLCLPSRRTEVLEAINYVKRDSSLGRGRTPDPAARTASPPLPLPLPLPPSPATPGDTKVRVRRLNPFSIESLLSRRSPSPPPRPPPHSPGTPIRDIPPEAADTRQVSQPAAPLALAPR